MKKILVVLILFSIFSCSKKDDSLGTTSTISSDMLSLKNSHEFVELYAKLSKMASKDELIAWSYQNNKNAILINSDTLLFKYSDVLRAMLNKDGKVAVGDSVIQFKDGSFYVFSKENPSLSVKIGGVKNSSVNNLHLKSVGSGTMLGSNSLDARNQYEFTQQQYQPCGGTLKYTSGLRKYVHEMYSESITINGSSVSSLHLRIKLEYKGSGSWKPAGEQRSISYSVTVDYYCGNNLYSSGGQTMSLSGSASCSGDIDRTIVSYPWADISWQIWVRGYIKQHVEGDWLSNEWNNTGYAQNTRILWD